MNDILLVGKWWGGLFVIGMAAWPMTALVFRGWTNKGYLLAKIVGLLTIGYLAWLGGMTRIVPFSVQTIVVILSGLFLINWKGGYRDLQPNWMSVFKDELVFLTIFAAWSWIKGHAPEINGLEKFMDFGFMQSIANSSYFPPIDMWFSGMTINYYYFGHLLVATLSKITTVDLSYGFGLILSTLCALTFSMSFAIGREMLATKTKFKGIFGPLFIATLVTFSGNLHTIYAFTTGYQSDNPPPFWQIWSSVSKSGSLSEGWNRYWYPNATRFIPYTIHEFPSYSFVVSDIHGHVLAIPIALLLVSLIITVWRTETLRYKFQVAVVYGIVSGAAFMTNALDGPIYLFLWMAMWLAIWWEERQSLGLIIKPIMIALIGFILTVLPFLITFRPFVSGVAVNCPASFLAGKTFGPLIFEEVTKCQRSPLWMMFILWGFFAYWGMVMFKKIPEDFKIKKLAILISIVCLLLVIFPEIFYFKDIYPLHFRSNTMFKLGYQVFILMSLVAGWTIVTLISNRKRISYSKTILFMGLPLIFLVMIFPFFAVRSYFGSLTTYKGLWGLNWMKIEFPENLQVIDWINEQKRLNKEMIVLEAQGDSYQDAVSQKPYNQVSTFTGVPTVAGWYVHEWLWRGQGEIANRADDVRLIYETADAQLARTFLNKYQVTHVLVGEMEREKYKFINEEKFASISKLVFETGQTKVYRLTD